jgi:hypothetical protein
MVFNLPDGRTFTLQGQESFTRRNGTQAILAVWRGPCAEPGCAEQVKAKTVKAWDPEWITETIATARCSAHAKPPPPFPNPKNGNLFTFHRFEPYTRKDGTPTLLQVWHGVCARGGCARAVVVKIPEKSRPELNRANFEKLHCKVHNRVITKARRDAAAASCRARSKVSDQDVADIRRLAAEGFKAKELELVFPLSQGAIREIISRRRRGSPKVHL